MTDPPRDRFRRSLAKIHEAMQGCTEEEVAAALEAARSTRRGEEQIARGEVALTIYPEDGQFVAEGGGVASCGGTPGEAFENWLDAVTLYQRTVAEVAVTPLADWPEQRRPRVVWRPHVVGGQPRLEGTRIPAEHIVEHVREGLTADDIAEMYDAELTPADVAACVAWAKRRGNPTPY